MIEFFEPIKEYENLYDINKQGEIYSHKSKRLLNPFKSYDGYLRINLSKNNSVKTKMIHRLVAETFIPNPKNLPVVNHIDGNKANPNVCNLEWVTFSENTIHAFEHGLARVSDKHRESARRIAAENGAKTTSKKVLQIDLSGNVISEFPSIREAERITNIRRQNIIRVCKTEKGTSGGFIWRYA